MLPFNVCQFFFVVISQSNRNCDKRFKDNVADANSFACEMYLFCPSVYAVSFLLVGEVLGFENLVLGIFDFVHALIETPRHRALMKKYIEQLIYYVFHYMQMTEEQASLFVLCRFLSDF